MNREDIIRMAREADREWDCDRDMVEWLEWFAALVAAAEREACAKVADDHERQRCEAWAKVLTTGGEVPSASLSAVAAAIRARGQTDKTCPPCHGDCNQGRACPARGGHA